MASIRDPIVADNSGSAASQLGFTGQTLIFAENFVDCIQPSERSQVHVSQCLVDLRQPALYGSLDANRHFRGNGTNQVPIFNDCRSSHENTFLSQLPPRNPR
jgi:hypothetical protein